MSYRDVARYGALAAGLATNPVGTVLSTIFSALNPFGESEQDISIRQFNERMIEQYRTQKPLSPRASYLRERAAARKRFLGIR